MRRDEDRAAAHLDGVLGGADHGGADPFVGSDDTRSPGLDPFEDRTGERRSQIAESLALASVDIFRHAARKADRFGLALVAQRIEAQQGIRLGAKDRPAHGFEQTIGHALDHCVEQGRVGFRADFEKEPDLRGETPAGFLDTRHASLGVERHDAGADVGCSRLDDVARLADGDFGSSAADIDVHDSSGFADRTGGTARAEGGERGFERVARAHRYEFSRLGREQISDGARVAAPDGDPGEDERTRIDRLRIDPGERVLPVDEAPER